MQARRQLSTRSEEQGARSERAGVHGPRMRLASAVLGVSAHAAPSLILAMSQHACLLEEELPLEEVTQRRERGLESLAPRLQGGALRLERLDE
jgi:hypothetical protein